jgi:hypothetical protein
MVQAPEVNDVTKSCYFKMSLVVLNVIPKKAFGEKRLLFEENTDVLELLCLQLLL